MKTSKYEMPTREEFENLSSEDQSRIQDFVNNQETQSLIKQTEEIIGSNQIKEGGNKSNTGELLEKVKNAIGKEREDLNLNIKNLLGEILQNPSNNLDYKSTPKNEDKINLLELGEEIKSKLKKGDPDLEERFNNLLKEA